MDSRKAFSHSSVLLLDNLQFAVVVICNRCFCIHFLVRLQARHFVIVVTLAFIVQLGTGQFAILLLAV